MKLTRTVTFQVEFDPDIETEAQFRDYTPEDVADMGHVVYDELTDADAPANDDDTLLLESDESDDFDEFFAEDDDDSDDDEEV